MCRVKNYELVLHRVEADLAAGRLRIGGRLPGERVLAEQLGISRPSVREAVRVLEAMGVVRTATGSGPEAGAVIVAEPVSPLTAVLRLHLATNHLPMGDVVQTRLLLESWAAREAAERRGGGRVSSRSPRSCSTGWMRPGCHRRSSICSTRSSTSRSRGWPGTC